MGKADVVTREEFDNLKTLHESLVEAFLKLERHAELRGWFVTDDAPPPLTGEPVAEPEPATDPS